MSIIRAKRKKNRFVQIDVTPLHDNRLSWKARGIMAFLMTKPDDWNVNEKNLISQSDKDGRDSLRAGIDELKALGYAVKVPNRDSRGRIQSWETLVFETPEDREEWEQSLPVHIPGNPHSGKPTIRENHIPGNPHSGKPNDLLIKELNHYGSELINDSHSLEQPCERESIASLPSEPVAPHPPASLSKNAEASDSDQHPVEDGYSANNSLAKLKPRPDRFTHPTEVEDRRLKDELYPWETSYNTSDRVFVEYVSKQMSSDGTQNPIGKARSYILNQQKTDAGLAKVLGHWEDYQERKRASIANQQLTHPTPLRTSPYIAEASLTPQEIERRKQVLATAKEQFEASRRTHVS